MSRSRCTILLFSSTTQRHTVRRCILFMLLKTPFNERYLSQLNLNTLKHQHHHCSVDYETRNLGTRVLYNILGSVLRWFHPNYLSGSSTCVYKSPLDSLLFALTANVDTYELKIHKVGARRNSFIYFIKM